MTNSTNFYNQKASVFRSLTLFSRTFCIFQENPRRGFSSFLPYKGKKFIFPALLISTGFSLSADSEQRLLAFGNSVAFLEESNAKNFVTGFATSQSLGFPKPFNYNPISSLTTTLAIVSPAAGGTNALLAGMDLFGFSLSCG